LKPDKSYVECIVRNKSARAVRVPSVYSGGYDSDVMLHVGANLYSYYKLVFWAGAKKERTQLLKPGQEMTVFKDELRAVFLLDIDKAKPLVPGEKRYYWSWSA